MNQLDYSAAILAEADKLQGEEKKESTVKSKKKLTFKQKAAAAEKKARLKRRNDLGIKTTLVDKNMEVVPISSIIEKSEEER